eukprot:comp21228_c0_seq1/m.45285 comp21228_c0_seq1/g.45285  ORF comp21228_c0_seq1/g.45285 comp21228_c0_seq1/m.45285 type:complete len:356 (-) comp21228_c0_seq1:57-1124(-)
MQHRSSCSAMFLSLLATAVFALAVFPGSVSAVEIAPNVFLNYTHLTPQCAYVVRAEDSIRLLFQTYVPINETHSELLFDSSIPHRERIELSMRKELRDQGKDESELRPLPTKDYLPLEQVPAKAFPESLNLAVLNHCQGDSFFVSIPLEDLDQAFLNGTRWGELIKDRVEVTRYGRIFISAKIMEHKPKLSKDFKDNYKRRQQDYQQRQAWDFKYIQEHGDLYYLEDFEDLKKHSGGPTMRISETGYERRTLDTFMANKGVFVESVTPDRVHSSRSTRLVLRGRGIHDGDTVILAKRNQRCYYSDSEPPEIRNQVSRFKIKSKTIDVQLPRGIYWLCLDGKEGFFEFHATLLKSF